MKAVHELRCRAGAARWALVLLVLGSGLLPVWAQAVPDGGQPSGPADMRSPAESAEARWETQSVRDLMQQDLRTALQAAPDGAVGPAGAGTRVQPLLAPRLVALYGVGRALMAEVQVGHQAYLYVRGQAWPAGHVGDRGVYQLRGMNGACVQLERGEDRHSLCLRMLLGEVQP